MFVNFNILNQLGSPAINSNTFANRPAAGQTGRLFVSTDTFEIYRDNGTGWDLIGGPGSSTVTGSGATGQVTYWTGTNTVSGENALFWDAAQNHLGINTATPGVALDVHSAADVALQLNGTGATPSIFQQFLSAGVSQYQVGYNWNASADYRRFSIYDSVGAKETITIDQQSRYVGINFQYTSLTDQPQYMLDLSGGSFHTNVGQYLVGTPTDLTRAFAASGNANSIAVWLEEYGNTTSSADIFFIKGRGTDTAKLNVQVGDSLGGMAFTGYLNAQYNPSVTWGTVVTNLDTTNNHANADFTIAQSYNTTALTENFRIVANGGNGYVRGNFGIGNQNPSNKLTVSVISGTAQDAINWNDGTRNGYLYIDGGGVGIFSGATATNQGIYLNNSASYIDFFTSSSTRSRITSTGNFLIGTTTDNGNKLQVNGNIYSSNEIYLDNGKYIRFQRISGGLSIQTLGIVSGTDDVRLLSTGNFDVTNGALTVITRVSSGGNYLIGTTTDNGQKLQINGNSTINGGLRYFDFLTPSTNFWESYHYNDNTFRLNYNGSGGDELILTNTGILTIGASYKSGAPNGGTAANWKLGTRVAAAVVLDTTQYIQLDVNGTLYKLAIVT